MRKPTTREASAFYFRYINQVQGENFMQTLMENAEKAPVFLNKLTLSQWKYQYAPDKWTIKEVILHVIDSERIFAYRALRIARGDQTPLPGFEQDDYVPLSNANERSPESIISEYKAVRNATLAMFKNFDEGMLQRMGTASDSPVSVLALGFIIAGHEQHHANILSERYL